MTVEVGALILPRKRCCYDHFVLKQSTLVIKKANVGNPATIGIEISCVFFFVMETWSKATKLDVLHRSEKKEERLKRRLCVTAKRKERRKAKETTRD